MSDLFSTWIPDPVGAILGTGYYRFESYLGVSGLGKITGTELDLLAVVSEHEGRGQFRNFIAAAKERFDSISVWEDWNPVVGKILVSYGFEPTQRCEKGETNTGWRWKK